MNFSTFSHLGEINYKFYNKIQTLRISILCLYKDDSRALFCLTVSLIWNHSGNYIIKWYRTFHDHTYQKNLFTWTQSGSVARHDNTFTKFNRYVLLILSVKDFLYLCSTSTHQKSSLGLYVLITTLISRDKLYVFQWHTNLVTNIYAPKSIA